MEFSSRQQADNWYNSAAYQKILPLRVNCAISDIVLIDELPQGFTVKAYADDVRRQNTGG